MTTHIKGRHIRRFSIEEDRLSPDIPLGMKEDIINTVWTRPADFNAEGATCTPGIEFPVRDVLKLRLEVGEVYDGYENTALLDLPNTTEFSRKGRAITIREYVNSGLGSDGDLAVSSVHNINTDQMIAGREHPDAPVFSVISLTPTQAVLSDTPPDGALNPGDEIVLYCALGYAGATANVGRYEALTVASVDRFTNTVSFLREKTKFFGSGEADDLDIGVGASMMRVMLQRVPNYRRVTVEEGGEMTCSSFDGLKGGVLFFRASEFLTVRGKIHANGRGYRGGIERFSGGNEYGWNGECVIPSYISKDPNHGGGGTARSNLVGNGSNGAASGGGGYGTVGGASTRTHVAGDGPGGLVFGVETLDKIFYGGGGGGGVYGGWNASTCEGNAAGGRAGGIVMIVCRKVVVEEGGTVESNGLVGGVRVYLEGGSGSRWNGSGGAGSGGAVYLMTVDFRAHENALRALGGPASAWGGGVGGKGRVAVYYKDRVGVLDGDPIPYSETHTRTYLESFLAVSKNLLDSAEFDELERFVVVVPERPAGTTMSLSISNDEENWETVPLVIGHNVVDLQGFDASEGRFYYKIAMGADSAGALSPVLDYVILKYSPDLHYGGTHHWRSQVVDTGLTGRRFVPTELYLTWVVDPSDQVNPKVQIEASHTRDFAEKATFPSEDTYYQRNGDFHIVNGEVNSLAGYITVPYRYWRVVVYLDTGTDAIDTPYVSGIRVKFQVPTALKGLVRVVDEDCNAAAGDRIYVKTTGGPVTVTLPEAASAFVGDNVVIKDATSAASVSPITVDGNGSTIDGEETLTVDQDGALVSLTYVGTELRWVVD
jgi:hypothetical protein